MRILIRNIIIFSILCIHISCKKDKGEANKNGIETQDEVTLSKLPEIKKLSAKVKSKTDAWIEFKELEAGIQRLYGSGDDLTEAEALVNLEITLSNSVFPEKFNIPPVLTRVLVLKTFLEQLEAGARDNSSVLELQDYKIRVIESYNSLLIQFEEALKRSVAEEFLK